MNTKRIAKSKATGLFFNGTTFEAKTISEAMEIRPGTTSEDFELVWGKGIEVIDAQIETSSDKFAIALDYVTSAIRNGQRTFTVMGPDGKYVSRKVNVPQTGARRAAWIKFAGAEVALVWKNGELAMDIWSL